jgi:hypothetical protein
MADYVRVKSGYLRDGRVVKSGEVLATDDPAVKGLPDDYFEPLDEALDEAGRSPGQRIVVPGTAVKDTVIMTAQEPSKETRASRPRVERATRAPGERRGDPPAEGTPRRGRGRPRLPRDGAGNIVRE